MTLEAVVSEIPLEIFDPKAFANKCLNCEPELIELQNQKKQQQQQMFA